MNKVLQGKHRQARIRSKIKAVTTLPRLSIFRSNQHMYAQIIDDGAQKTIVGVAEKKDSKTGTKTERARLLGQALAKLAQDKKVTEVVFDKGRFSYHGRVKAFAEGAREGGLKF
ncbi:MAG: large subunit ribosomal protein [Patescibacteria group bacterium]|jgi:large subunit ribosomal protein L18|nr:large subunit ribosomal protein [Patescibacteria group bacterium]